MSTEPSRVTNRLSIAMCTYNGARYLEEQLASIAAQTRLPDELIVCDDCSTDSTRQMLDDYAAVASFPVKLFANERNLGSTLNFEKSISLCTGDIIALSDQDDVWKKEKLARLESVFAVRPDVGLIFSDAELVDENTNKLGQTLWNRVGITQSECERLKAGNAYGELLPGSTATGATMAFRARFKDLALPIPADLPLIHDAWIALVIGAVAELAPLDEPLMFYRDHPNQQVGPRARQVSIGGLEALTAGMTQDALRRPNPYSEMLAIARALHARLFDRGGVATPGVMRTLEARISHLEARSNLPQPGPRRIGMVLRELLTLRYHRYSKGISSAAKDILAKDETAEST